MKRFFALLLACWVLCLSVCADEIIDDPVLALDPAPVVDSAPALDPAPSPDPAPVVDPAPASDPVPDEVIDVAPIETPAPVSPPVDPVVDVSVPTFTLDEVLAVLPESSGSPDVVSEDVVLTGVSRVSVPPVTPSSSTGLKAALLTVLGNYDPVVVVYEYSISSSSSSRSVTDTQPDYVWIASAALLCLVIWCLFKLGGALIRG